METQLTFGMMRSCDLNKNDREAENLIRIQIQLSLAMTNFLKLNSTEDLFGSVQPAPFISFDFLILSNLMMINPTE